MKKLNLFWKIVIVVFVIAVLIYAYNKVQNYYHYHKEVYSCYSISENCEVVKFLDENARVRLKSTKAYTTPILSWVANPMENDSLTVFIKDGKRGYLNVNTGRIIIPARFQRAWFFSEGLAAVLINNRIGFINSKGETVIDYKYPYNPDKDINMDFLFKKDLCAVRDTTGKTGIINKQDKWVLLPSYSYIYMPVKNYRVVVDGKYSGVIDSSLNIVIPVKYERVKVRKDGFLIVSNYTQQLIGFDYKTVLIPFIYDDSHVLFYNTEYTSNGEHDLFERTNFSAFEINGKEGILNSKGKIIVPAMYDDVAALSPELYTCQTGEEWITVNDKGEKVN